MSDSTDDPWNDLYAELEVENAAKTAAPPPLPAEADDDGDEADDGPDEGEAVGEGGEPLAEGEQPKKRRRRRRRRKGGKGPNGEPLPADGEGLAVTDGDDVPPEAATDDEAEAEEGEPAAVGAESPDQSREMIRTWNVPSWKEIVAGLYRPDRG